NAIAKIRVRPRGGLDQEDLIGADAEMAIGQGACALGRHVDSLAYAIEHDKVVARAMHFGEVPDHGGIIAHYVGAWQRRRDAPGSPSRVRILQRGSGGWPGESRLRPRLNNILPD